MLNLNYIMLNITICTFKVGNKWCEISRHLPGIFSVYNIFNILLKYLLSVNNIFYILLNNIFYHREK